VSSLLRSAVDLGVTFFDTAQVYGPFTNEILVGQGWLSSSRRDRSLEDDHGANYAELRAVGGSTASGQDDLQVHSHPVEPAAMTFCVGWGPDRSAEPNPSLEDPCASA
jgi:hypothetical protein